MKFRRPTTRSHKSSSILRKDPIAIVPPRKVIKARYSWQAPSNNSVDDIYNRESPTYLSFEAGDFLHVVGHENDSDWYEACNPIQGKRGLVPVRYFELVEKTVRDSGSSATSLSATGSLSSSQPTPGKRGSRGRSVITHDSGYAERSQTNSAEESSDRTRSDSQARSMSKSSGAMVYGVVMYDFKAERMDELDAKEGEAIIVIAQSNPDWFVAKPITRLGGPGLIPVSFIEVRDMATGEVVSDVREAVRRACVPKVEEWKKMAADYKNGSIPLGKLSSTQPATSQAADRTSFDNSSRESRNVHVRALSRSDSKPVIQSRNQQQYQQPHQRQQHRHHDSVNYPPQQGSQHATSASQSSSNNDVLIPVNASVPRFCFADETFWFIIECVMEDGSHWELSRLYQDFYDLQINLLTEFPLEAGRVAGVERRLPLMPGPVTYVDHKISNGRRYDLDKYLQNLLRLGQNVTGSYLVRRFFAPQNSGDYEIDPDEENRSSGDSVRSENSPISGGGELESGSGFPQLQNQEVQSRQSQSSLNMNQVHQHYRDPSDLPGFGNTVQPKGSVLQGSMGSGTTRIKVRFEEDSCVVIRMPQFFRYSDLLHKLRDRWALEKGLSNADSDFLMENNMVIEYLDDIEGEMFRIDGNEDLEFALSRNPKLTLMVYLSR